LEERWILRVSGGPALSTSKITFSFLLVLAIIFAVPIAVYGTLSTVSGLQPPGDSPLMFLLGVFVSKMGTAAAFVLIFCFARSSWSGQWLLYAAIWWLMFSFGEIGQAIGPNYSWQDAIAGIISETIYLPLSAYLVNRLMKT
jgi:hypothetical protein